MKKLGLILVLCVSSVLGVFAQKSAAEITSELTEAQKFINECSFYKTEYVSKYSDNGLDIRGVVLTDLKSGKKVGSIKFQTESKKALAAFTNIMFGAGSYSGGNTNSSDGSSYSLGYLNISEVDDLLKVLNTIVEEKKVKSKYKDTRIEYTATGGIWVYYNKKKDECTFSKKWYSVNKFGTLCESTIETEDQSCKDVAKLIKAIENARDAVLAELSGK